jgi:thymidylate synthase (FAD)
MNKIEVKVIIGPSTKPASMMMFLAKLTQRGHKIKNMDDLNNLLDETLESNRTNKIAERVIALPHGTIKRFTPIVVAIVGASRRFLAQARTHHVGINWVSASLQYSDYTDEADFVVPYELLNDKKEMERLLYLQQCNNAMVTYKALVQQGCDNDTAGYVAPQGLRNILVGIANHEAWLNFIRVRSCNRNTEETQYITMKVWEALSNTLDGNVMFKYAGPDCLYGKCREGKMCCGNNFPELNNKSYPTEFIKQKWPLLYGGK